MIIDGLKNDDSVIECNLLYCLCCSLISSYNLGTSFVVRDMPKYARDYLYRMVVPVAKRHGMFVNEYPCWENIYNKETSDCCVLFETKEKVPFESRFQRTGFLRLHLLFLLLRLDWNRCLHYGGLHWNRHRMRLLYWNHHRRRLLYWNRHRRRLLRPLLFHFNRSE